MRACFHVWIGHERSAPNPDPFDPDEPEAILAWFARNEPYWCPWLFFLFWTGVRHGEAAALRWNDIDLKRGIISIARSRDEGEDNRPRQRVRLMRFRCSPGSSIF